MISKMKRRKMAVWLQKLNTLLLDPTKDAYAARREALAMLQNIFPPPKAKAPKTQPKAQAVPDMRRRSNRALYRDQIHVVSGPTNVFLTNAVYSSIIALLREGKLIHAIKEFRSATGSGLKEAKDVIEQYPAFKAHWPQKDW